MQKKLIFFNSIKTNFLIKRSFLFFLLIIFFLLFLLLNLYNLQIKNFENYKRLSNKNRVKIITLIPHRGIIYDRNNIPIAINRTSYNINIIPSKVNNLNVTLEKIKNIINIDDENISLFKKKYLKFSHSLILKKNLNEIELSKFLLNKHILTEFKIIKNNYRYYPYSSLLTHSLGYVSKRSNNDISFLKKKGIHFFTNNIGKIGIEKFYEDKLHGKHGYQALEVNNFGKIVRQLYIKLPESGYNIFLTLDIKLQNYIYNLLSGSKAAVIVTNVKNGEILAMISNPSYDVNSFVKGISIKEFSDLIKNVNCPLMNRVTQGTYPPASTVKPYIVFSALKSGIINLNSNLYDPGWWKLPGSKKIYRDWKRTGHGKVNIIKSIEESSDTFFYQISFDMGIDNLYFWMNQFGYGNLTGIDLLEEKKGILPNKIWKLNRFNIPWYLGDTIPVGIGQGYWTATPLQINKALMILANYGKIKYPHLLKHMNKNNNFIYFEKNNQNIKNILITDKKYWNIIKKGMYGVANKINGTSYKYFIGTPYKIAAKSGTAQLFKLKENEIYDSNQVSHNLRDHKLMIAFAPYHNASIAISIILENGGEKNISIGNIMRKIFDYIYINTNFL